MQPTVGRPTSRDECASWFRALPDDATVRITGLGTRAQPKPRHADSTTHELCTDGMRRIQRLEPGDLTCSVDAGLPVRTLVEALAAEHLCLPCEVGDASGTVGGLFASDPWPDLSTSRRAPRSLLLGIEAVLAEGKPFKAGASVVKSVAGFDLAKLFVGSRGTLFATTTMHLRLAAQPHAAQAFAEASLDLPGAWQRFDALRRSAGPLIELRLTQSKDGECAVHGTFAGMTPDVDTAMRERKPTEHAIPWAAPELAANNETTAASSEHVLRGHVALRSASAWLTGLPRRATCLLGFGGGFEVRLPAGVDVQAVLLAFLAAEAAALVVGGPHVGLTTARNANPTDDRAVRLETDLRSALDPKARLR